MAHHKDPRRLLAVDAGQVLLQPLDLLVGLVVLPLVVGDLAKGAGVGDEGLVLRRQGLAAGQVAQEGILGRVGIVRLAVDRDEVSQSIVEGIPEVAHASRLGARHAETVLVGGKVPLRGRTRVVAQRGLGRAGVGAVEVEVGGELVGAAVKLGAARFVVAREDLVGDLGGDGGHPLLPQVPVVLVDDGEIAPLRTSLVGDLAGGQGDQILGRNGIAARELRRGAVVADGPVGLARQHARVPVICGASRYGGSSR